VVYSGVHGNYTAQLIGGANRDDGGALPALDIAIIF